MKKGLTKTISLKDQTLEYEFRRSQRARRLRLAVYCGGSLVVTAPRRFDFLEIEKFILDKADWIFEKIDIMKKKRRHSTLPRGGKRGYCKFKSQALALAQQKVREFNRFYGFKFSRINIRNQKTRWGSCSKKGNLNFNYKIVYLPEKYVDYVVVHELCHLKEFNHSRAFWNLVARTIPDFRQRRKEIRNI